MSQTVEMNAADSTSVHEQEGGKKAKSRRPPNTAFRQQRLKAWQPILTPKTVLPIFFVVGVIFAPLGGLLLWASSMIQEISIDYSRCSTLATNEFTNIPSNLVHTDFKTKNSSSIYQWRVQNIQVPYGNDRAYTLPTNQCTLRFEIPNELGSPIYMYYRLTKFYQNHRRYVKSLNQDQLVGNFVDNSTIASSDCDPLKLDPSGKAFYPCGLIANSLFNDTIQSPQLVTSNTADVAAGPEAFSMTNEGIAWGSDRNLYKEAPYTADQVVPPPNWVLQYPQGYNDNFPIPDISTWEEFQVWMRTAGLPTFSKMALRSDNQRMPAGVYEMNIYDYFPVTEYGGTKEILISTRSVIGGKNDFLGIAYIIVGGLCLILGALFTATHIIRPRKMADHNHLSFGNDLQGAGAVASGRDARPGTAGLA